tara:strand:- start:359 stop:1165 length:807 start_codon:yes stop_codon:yes gene_type:complete
MKKKVCILGRGPSLKHLENFSEDFEDVVLVNDHIKTVRNELLLKKIKDKNSYVLCNINGAGFKEEVAQQLNLKKFVTNRLKPDWDLWKSSKEAQKKHYEGGYVDNLGYLPFLSEDEPYLNCLRGPAGMNLEKMKSPSGRDVEHMPDSAEKYLLQVYEDKIIANCGYFATLFSLLELGATHIYYFGFDFYDNVKIDKSWYVNPPEYGTKDWWTLRYKYEGEHMKVLWEKYATDFFPDVVFEFYTMADIQSKNRNINYHKVENSSTDVYF